jgi:hypothetical protein
MRLEELTRQTKLGHVHVAKTSLTSSGDEREVCVPRLPDRFPQAFSSRVSTPLGVLRISKTRRLLRAHRVVLY